MITISREQLKRYEFELLDIAEQNGGVIVKDPKHMEECFICKGNGKLIKHHMKYNPEVIIMICRGCHAKIHTAEWGWNQYEPYDPYMDYSSPYRNFVWYTRTERNEFYKYSERSEQIKRFCGICRYKTLVYPPDHSRCSGCGKSYPEQTIQETKPPEFWIGDK